MSDSSFPDLSKRANSCITHSFLQSKTGRTYAQQQRSTLIFLFGREDKSFYVFSDCQELKQSSSIFSIGSQDNKYMAGSVFNLAWYK
jgi:hypothetical protein